LERAVRSVSWVSIDIFDTAVFRCVPEPEDVFEIVGIRARGRAGMPSNPQQFRTMRVEAERSAREEAWLLSRAEEVTLDHIYACLHDALPELDVDDTMNEELAVERAVCVANPDIKALYERLQREGRKVTFVSDTYLPASFVDELLSGVGYGGCHELFVSSECNATKRHGSLFSQVASALDVPPARILHIGDRFRSDFHNGRKAGFETYWYRKTVRPRESFRSERTLAGRVLARIEALAIDGGDGKTGCFDAFAAGVLGPLFLGLTQWLARSVKEQGAELVLICAREGYVIHQIYERLRRGGDVPPSSYFMASRRALSFPALTKVDERALDVTLCVGAEGAPMQAFFERIGLDISAFPVELAETGCDATTRVATASDYAKLRELFTRLEPYVLEAAAAERPLVLDYFRSTGFSPSSKQLAFFDIGWGGSLLEATSALVRESGARTECRAYYLATDERILNLRREAGIATSWLSHGGAPDDVHRAVHAALWLLEVFFCAPHGSVIGYRRDEAGAAAPVLREFDHDSPQAQAVSSIQQASLRFVDRWLEIFGGAGLEISRDDAFRRLQRFVERPTNREIAAFGDFAHLDHLGSTAIVRPLAPVVSLFEMLTHPKSVIARYRSSFWKLGFLQGLLRNSASARMLCSALRQRSRLRALWHRFRETIPSPSSTVRSS
jgi:FMN phosphatase YigB (HAD superfamily)